METLHLDKPKLRGSDYFGAMNQRKQEPRAFDCFGAMHLDNQFLLVIVVVFTLIQIFLTRASLKGGVRLRVKLSIKRHLNKCVMRRERLQGKMRHINQIKTMRIYIRKQLRQQPNSNHKDSKDFNFYLKKKRISITTIKRVYFVCCDEFIYDTNNILQHRSGFFPFCPLNSSNGLVMLCNIDFNLF